MKNVLHILSSPRGDRSTTVKLGNAIINQLKATASEEVVVKTLDLSRTPFPHLTPLHLEAFHTPSAYRTPEQAAAAKYSDDAIRELEATDILVLGAPMYNYGIPSVLKAYFDHIVRAGITFGFSNGKQQGLFKNTKAYIAFASGWDFSDPALQPYDFNIPYLKAILGLIGITDVTVFRVEGATHPDLKEAALALITADIVL